MLKPSRAAGFLYKFFLVVAWAGCVSCDSLITTVPQSQLPGAASKLVVQSFIAPQDTLLRVWVSESAPYFTGTDYVAGSLSNARVILSDGSRQVRLQYDTSNLHYTVKAQEFPILEGGTYFLTVTEGDRTAEATTTVPRAAVPITSYQLDTMYTNIYGPYSRHDTALIIRYTWKDLPGAPDFYRTSASVMLQTTLFETDEQGELLEHRVSNLSRFHWDNTFSRGEFQQDTHQDGQEMTTSRGKAVFHIVNSVLTPNGIVYAKANNRVERIRLELLRTDENYYRYHQSIERRADSDNPFAEPAPVFSNVTGGLGVFASFNSFSLLVKP